MQKSFIQIIKKLLQIVPQTKWHFIGIQILIITNVFMEMVNIAIVGGMIALFSNNSLIQSNQYLSWFFTLTGAENEVEFLLYLSVLSILFLLFSSLFSMLAFWRITLFSNRLAFSLKHIVYKDIIHKNWLFHTQHHSAKLINLVQMDCNRINFEIILPLINTNSRIILIFLIITALAVVNPLFTLIIFTALLSGYALIFSFVKNRVAVHGKYYSLYNGKLIKTLINSLGGIKDILLLNKQNVFLNDFNNNAQNVAYSQSILAAAATIPRYFIEFITFSLIIIAMFYFVYTNNMAGLLPLLGIYALSAFKLLPASQQIYRNFSTIKGGIGVLRNVINSLSNNAYQQQQIGSLDAIDTVKNIKLSSVSFRYPNKKACSICDVSLSIDAGISVGLVGHSGSGKSTLVDILLGFIAVDKGEFRINNVPINSKNIDAWQHKCAFVPQHIFLIDASISENIAFGIAKDDINQKQIEIAAKLAHLDEFVSELDLGLETQIGEMGVQLSGGQRQRIGIARALYSNAEVLFFDEATSALDNISEQVIMQAIKELSGKRTIILIAHRLQTVQECKIIYFIKNGKIIDQGSYQQLLENNADFKKMAYNVSQAKNK